MPQQVIDNVRRRWREASNGVLVRGCIRGCALFFVGLGTIPVDGGALPWLKWGGAVVALGACIGAYTLHKRAGAGM